MNHEDSYPTSDERQLDAIFREARRSMIERRMHKIPGGEVPAFVLTYAQRNLLERAFDPRMPRFEPAVVTDRHDGPDLLYGIPCLWVRGTRWKVTPGLVDLREVE